MDVVGEIDVSSDSGIKRSGASASTSYLVNYMTLATS